MDFETRYIELKFWWARLWRGYQLAPHKPTLYDALRACVRACVRASPRVSRPCRVRVSRAAGWRHHFFWTLVTSCPWPLLLAGWMTAQPIWHAGTLTDHSLAHHNRSAHAHTCLQLVADALLLCASCCQQGDKTTPDVRRRGA